MSQLNLETLYRNLPAEVIQQVVFTIPDPTSSLRFAAPLEMAP